MWKKKRYKKISPPGQFKIWLIILVLLIILAAAIFKFGVFNIKAINIKVEGACVDENQLKDKSELLGQNLFLINPSKTEQILKNKFYCLKSVTISKHLPSDVTIYVSSRQPVAELVDLKEKIATTSALIETVATPSAEQIADSYLMDDEGVFFAKASQEDLLKIYSQGLKVSLGKTLEETTKNNLLKVLEKTKKFGVQTGSSWISDDLYIIDTSPKIIFDLKKQIDIQLASLQLILEKAKMNAETLVFIDLRFDKPVVRYAPKK